MYIHVVLTYNSTRCCFSHFRDCVAGSESSWVQKLK